MLLTQTRGDTPLGFLDKSKIRKYPFDTRNKLSLATMALSISALDRLHCEPFLRFLST